MNTPAEISTVALNRLRAATGVTNIVESGLVSDKLSRDGALRMIEFCKWVAVQQPSQKEEERLLAILHQGLFRVATMLSQHDPLGLKPELATYLPEDAPQTIAQKAPDHLG